ncbi:unnamed protein product [Paramecium primaurelia]|uniref:Uncharacterized protein n=1 Tax=Paramecium primaurelia TaxID=5886 RepID=A0A8S1QML1_PARPR|nr:unnamed protein product [Paramecium primaurelia]
MYVPLIRLLYFNSLKVRIIIWYPQKLKKDTLRQVLPFFKTCELLQNSSSFGDILESQKNTLEHLNKAVTLLIESTLVRKWRRKTNMRQYINKFDSAFIIQISYTDSQYIPSRQANNSKSYVGSEKSRRKTRLRENQFFILRTPYQKYKHNIFTTQPGAIKIYNIDCNRVFCYHIDGTNI